MKISLFARTPHPSDTDRLPLRLKTYFFDCSASIMACSLPRPFSLNEAVPSTPFRKHIDSHGVAAPSLDVVIKLNNEAVRLFETNEISEAETFFQLCLDEIFELKIGYMEKKRKVSRVAATMRGPSAQTSCHGKAAYHKCLLNPLLGWSKPHFASSSNGSNDGTQQGDYPAFIFSRALFLRKPSYVQCQRGEDFTFLLEICTSAILFNKAIINHIRTACNHLLPSCTQQQRSFTIWNVQNDYEQSFNALKRLGKLLDDDKTTSFLDVNILVLALFNNTGILYCNEMARFSDASDCFCIVSRVALQLRDLDQRLNKEEISSLCRNAWMVPTIATPAA